VAGRALEAPGEPCHLQGAVAVAGIVTSAQGTPVRAVTVPGCQPGPSPTVPAAIVPEIAAVPLPPPAKVACAGGTDRPLCAAAEALIFQGKSVQNDGSVLTHRPSERLHNVGGAGLMCPDAVRTDRMRS
jgi:hypothetical protein